MDKLMDSSLFMKIISLLLALLLFITVNFESQNKTGLDGATTSKSSAEVIKDVPVTVIYDEENLVVTGVPDVVDVSIEGPNAIVQTTKALRNFEVFVDLSDAQIGEKRVPIQIREISDKLDVSIEPPVAKVSIQERVTKEFKVEAEFNQNMIEEGYYAEQPEVEPNKVKVTGAKDVIEKISYVKATIDNSWTISQTITREATVLVLDEKLNKLPVIVEPEIVQVTIPVKSSTKTVPISIVEKGSPPSGVIIDSISLNVQEATITADADILSNIENVRVEVDLSKITKNIDLDLPVIIPDGVVKVEPRTVKVNVRVFQDEETTITKIPIKTVGLIDNLRLTFNDPTNGQTNIVASGPRNVIKNLRANDFELTIDAANLDVGDHELKINVKGPNNIKWKLSQEIAKVTIVEAE